MMITTGIEPAGFRYDYAPSSRKKASVALLPGLFAGEWIWESTNARLRAEEYSVIRLLDPVVAFDWRSGGIEDLRPTLCAVLDQHAVERCTLCGNSLGGLVALDFARHYPERVDSLVVSGAPGLEPEINLGIGTPREVSREFVLRLVENLFHDPGRATEDMIQRTADVLSDRRHFVNAVRALKAPREYPILDVLPEIRCPVLLTWGENDRVTPVENWKPWARALDTLHLQTIPQCGHSPMIERPQVFNELLLGFLRRRREH
jgi:pimeloyl-ACP methyl ester carboxylesterase